MYSYHSAHGCISTAVNLECYYSSEHGYSSSGVHMGVLALQSTCTNNGTCMHEFSTAHKDTSTAVHMIYQHNSTDTSIRASACLGLLLSMMLGSVHWIHTQECFLCSIKTCLFFQNSYICLLSFVLGILHYFFSLPYTSCQILSSRKSLSEPKFLVFCCFGPLHLILVAYMSMVWVIHWILASYQRLYH